MRDTENFIPPKLQDLIQKGRIIPFVGAGTSMSVRRKENNKPLFPSWKELLLSAADRLEQGGKEKFATGIRGQMGMGDSEYFLDSARIAQKQLGQEWFELLRETFNPKRDQVEESSLAKLETIWRLGSPLVIITNFDRTLEWACPKENRDNINRWKIESPHEQVDSLRGNLDRPTLWHLHGSIEQVDQLILTPQGYKQLYLSESAESKYKTALETLRGHLAAKSFLFLGFSFSDQHFSEQLKQVSETFSHCAGPHYVLIRKDHASAFENLGFPLEVLTKDFL